VPKIYCVVVEFNYNTDNEDQKAAETKIDLKWGSFLGSSGVEGYAMLHPQMFAFHFRSPNHKLS